MSTEQFPAGPQRNEDEVLAVLASRDLLRVTAERRNRMAVVHARGEVELATVGRLGAVLDHELVSGAIDILLDLRDVTFIDCSGVSVLVDTTYRAAAAPPALGNPRVGRRARPGGRLVLTSGS